MIYIFHGDEIITVNEWPMNPSYPLGTWAVGISKSGNVWYHVAKGTFETFWAFWPNTHGIPDKHQLQLLLLGD